MEKFDKGNILTICIAGILLLALVIVLIVGGCARRENPEWNPLKPWEKPETVDTTEDDTKPEPKPSATDPSNPSNASDPTVNSSATTPTTGSDNQPTTAPTTDQNQPTTAPTTPESTTAPTTGTETPPESTAPTEGDGLLTWEEYEVLTGPEQRAYKATFPSLDAYLAWRAAALQAYHDAHTGKMENGKIDLEDAFG